MSSGGGGGSTTQKTVPWSGQQPYLKDLFGQAQSTYQQDPIQPYTGTRVAGLSDATKQGMQSLVDRSQGSPYQSAMSNYLTNTLNTQNVDPSMLSQYGQQAAGGIGTGQDLMAQAGMGGVDFSQASNMMNAGQDLNFGGASQYAGGVVNPYVQSLAGMGTYGSLGEASQWAGQPDMTALTAAQGSAGQAGNMANSIYGNAGLSLGQSMAQAGGSIDPNATSQLQQTASGDYLGSNPYLDQAYQTAAGKATQSFQEDVLPSLAAQFGAAGRTGSGAQALATGRAAGDLSESLAGMAGDIYGNAYESERNRQLQASGQLGQLGLGSGQLGADIYGTSGQLGLGAGNLALGTGELQNTMYGTQNQAELGRLGLASDIYLGERGLGQQAAQQAGQLSLGGGQLASDLYGTGSQADISRLNTAANLYSSGQDRMLSAGESLGQLGLGGLNSLNDLYSNIGTQQFRAGSLAPSAQQMDYADINALLQSGAISEDQSQRVLDARMAAYNERQQAPWSNLQNYANIVYGLPGGYGTTTGSQSSGSRLSGVLGGAMVGGQTLGPWGALGGALLGGLL